MLVNGLNAAVVVVQVLNGDKCSAVIIPVVMNLMRKIVNMKTNLQLKTYALRIQLVQGQSCKSNTVR